MNGIRFGSLFELKVTNPENKLSTRAALMDVVIDELSDAFTTAGIYNRVDYPSDYLTTDEPSALILTDTTSEQHASRHLELTVLSKALQSLHKAVFTDPNNFKVWVQPHTKNAQTVVDEELSNLVSSGKTSNTLFLEI